MNVCRSCGQDFGSIHTFEMHRVGVHTYTFAQGMGMSPPREDGRRCLDPDEYEARGFVRNSYGRWSTKDELRRGRAIRVGAKGALVRYQKMRTPDVTCECGHRRDNHDMPKDYSGRKCYWCECAGFSPRDRSVVRPEEYSGKQVVDAREISGHRRPRKTV